MEDLPLQDCELQVGKGKRSTGRVVASKDLYNTFGKLDVDCWTAVLDSTDSGDCFGYFLVWTCLDKSRVDLAVRTLESPTPTRSR